jgi:DMSO/TMAO reductase YedYZ molybdopterin-dependent catalytic subunit
VTLPTAAEPAPAIPAGAQIELDGISPYITPNKDFYRIDTALSVPDVPTDGYNLRIHGMVDRELNLSYQDLLDMPLEEHRVTLTCVSNEVGGPYVGNATWLGIRTSTLLEMAGVQSGADAVLSTSADGWNTGTPLEAVTDDRTSLIAVGMNGEPLPLIHGFPVRMVVPGLYGYVSATKWLTDIEVSRFADFTAYWTSRDYDAQAPIKFSSRIDVPGSFEALPRDNVRVGGVAWAQTVGIAKVEVKIDDGDWVEAELGASDNDETWRQWSWEWQDATTGNHGITVRATNKNGETQTSDRAPIRPNGTTGWHSVQFRVE